jgi:hypothetical protein
MLKNLIRDKCPFLILAAVMMSLPHLGSVHVMEREPEERKKKKKTCNDERNLTSQ